VNLVEVGNATRVGIDEEAVAALVDRVLEAEGVCDAELGVEFVGERRIRHLNRDHRGKDEVTDVLSFALEDAGEEPDDVADADGPPRLLGDIVICARQALRQARADGLPGSFELAVLLVHGTLHLLGHDHETDAGQMALRQAEVMELVSWEGLLAASR
jgi:probable rRNA maturation factor